MNVFSSISLLLLAIDLGLVDADFCQAVNGVYRERPNDPGATESPAFVDLSYHYDLEISPDVPDLELNPVHVAQTLQQRLADALVFTLFDDCRVDPSDKLLAQVNLLEIDVQVYAVADSHGLYEAQVQAIGDTAVGEQETVLAQQRLENAVRMTVTQHHVARFSVQDGAIMTLRLPQDPIAVTPPGGDDEMTQEPPQTTPPPLRHWTPLASLVGGCAAVLVLGLAVLMRRHHSSNAKPRAPRQVHFTLPGEEDDDVELACSKPTSKLMRHHCDPTETETELSESSGDHEEW